MLISKGRVLALAVAALVASAWARYQPDNWNELTVLSGSATGGKSLSESAYRVTADASYACSIDVPENATVTIYFANGATLEVSSPNGGCSPGVRLPSSSTLILRSYDEQGGTLVARGGSGGDAGNGVNADDASLSGGYAPGGRGGMGAYGGGAGIGGSGGSGGMYGVRGESGGNRGANGSTGGTGGSAGRLFVYDGIAVQAFGAAGGARGEGGSGGDYGGFMNAWSGGGGGGGGGQGGNGASIGGGGAGGGGGGGGGGANEVAGAGGNGGAGYGRGGGGGIGAVGHSDAPNGDEGGATEGGRGAQDFKAGGYGGDLGQGGSGGEVICYDTVQVCGGSLSSGSGYGGGAASSLVKSVVTLDVTANLAGHALTNDPDTYMLAYSGALFAAPILTPTCSGLTFRGFYSEQTGGTRYIDADGTPSATALGSVTTLYAQWEASAGDRKAEFVVTTLDDPTDSAIVFYDGVVSLREALCFAQLNPTETNVQGTRAITFADALYGQSGAATLALSRALDDAHTGVTSTCLCVQGPTDGRTLTLDGQKANRHFSLVQSATTLQLSHLVLSRGRNAARGGSIYLGAGAGALELACCRFEDCRAGTAGGAVCADGGTLTATRCQFGIADEGLYCGAPFGGAIGLYDHADALITESTFLACAASDGGGALYVRGYTATPTLCIVNSSLVNCTAGTDDTDLGGAIYSVDATVRLVNATLRGNSVGGDGGGLYAQGGQVQLLNALLVGNTAGAGNADYTAKAANAALHVHSCFGQYGVTSDYSVNESVQSGAAEGQVYQHDQTDADRFSVLSRLPAKLYVDILARNSLARKGAFVYHDARYANVAYRASATGSLKTLVGASGQATATLDTDIYGIAYDFDLAVPGIGCVWYRDLPSLEVTIAEDVVNIYDGEVSLREAVAYAGAFPDDLVQDDRFDITFADALTSGQSVLTCAWARTQIEVQDLKYPLRLAAPGWGTAGARPLVLDGTNAWRHFRVWPGNELQLRGVCLVRGFGANYGETFPGYNGGAIQNNGILDALDCRFEDNRAGGSRNTIMKTLQLAGDGGAVYAAAGATTTVERCTFVGNAAVHGGALANAGFLTAVSSTLASNTAGQGSGGGSTGTGGACWAGGGDTAFVHCTITDNAATGGTGGGVWADTGADDAATPLHFADTVLVGNTVGAAGTADDLCANGVGVVDAAYSVFGATNGTTAVYLWADTSSFGFAPGYILADDGPHTTAAAVPQTYYPVQATYLDTGAAVAQQRDGTRYETLYFSPTGSAGTWEALRGPGGRRVPTAFDLVAQDQLGATPSSARFFGAVCQAASGGQTPLPDDVTDEYAVTEASWAAFVQAVARLAASGPKEGVAITFAGDASNATLLATAAIPLAAFTNVPLVVEGPVSFKASGANRFFTLGADNRAVFRNVKFLAGGSAALDIGGAIWGLDGSHLATSNCLFSGNRAQWGGAVGMDGQTVLDFYQTDFANNAAANADQGHDVYQEKGTSAISGGAFDPAGFVSWALDAPAPLASAYAGRSWYTLTARADGGTVATLNASAEPVAAAVEIAQDGSDTVSLMPENVKPFLWYALEWAETPTGPYTVVESSWQQADANGVLPAALTAPATGTSGFYRVVTATARGGE